MSSQENLHISISVSGISIYTSVQKKTQLRGSFEISRHRECSDESADSECILRNHRCPEILENPSAKHRITRHARFYLDLAQEVFCMFFAILSGIATICHVTTFRHPSGAYICQMPGHRLSWLTKGTPSESRLSIGTIGLGKTVSCMHRIVEWYPKNAKILFLNRPRYKILEFFTIAPVLTSTLTVCRRNRGDPLSLYRT